MSSWILNWYFEIFVNDNFILKTHENDCAMGMITIGSIGDLIRCISFNLTLYYYTRKTKKFFPLPFTWIFQDFKLFIIEPICYQVFKKYLEAKEPNSIFFSFNCVRTQYSEKTYEIVS